MDLLSAMAARKSARAFLDKPVSRADIEEIITYAAMAPSAINLQPWEYIVTCGEEKDRLIRRLQKTHAERSVPCGPGTTEPLPEKFTQRSRKVLELMTPHIAADGRPFNRFIEEGSCSFYGAPIAIIATIDRIFPEIRYLDVGLSLGYFFLAAEAKGLATCPVGLIMAYRPQIAEVLEIPDEKEILLAIALGYADPEASVNRVKTTREPLSEILRWYE